jgi:ferredoxin
MLTWKKIALTISTSKIEIRLVNEERTFVGCDKGTTLLDDLIQNKANVYYQCKDGFCGCCRTMLLSGEIEYVKSIIPVAQKGEIFPCACVAKTSLELESVEHSL